MATSERWKEIAGFAGYKVSDQGRISSTRGYRGKAVPRRILSSCPTRKGYLVVVLCRAGQKCPRYVHRLVAEAFIGAPKKMHVNHLDGSKLNNWSQNLEYVTPKQNTRHAIRQGLIVFSKHAQYQRKLSDSQITQIRQRLSAGESMTALAVAYGVSRKTVAYWR